MIMNDKVQDHYKRTANASTRIAMEYYSELEDLKKKYKLRGYVMVILLALPVLVALWFLSGEPPAAPEWEPYRGEVFEAHKEGWELGWHEAIYECQKSKTCN